MQLSPEFHENVGPLADVLASADVDIHAFFNGTALGDTTRAEWRTFVEQYARENPGRESVDDRLFTVTFALGYLQATANQQNTTAGALLHELFPDV